jgi:prepilin-type processing-associated H-X9-DG protein
MNDQNIEQILNRLGSEDVPADVRELAEQTSREFDKTLAPSKQYILWSDVVRSRITKLAAAAAIIVAVLVVMQYFRVPVDVASVAWGEVLENIENAKTLAWKTTFVTAGQKPQIARTMVLEPYYMRVELPDGKIWILDHSLGNTLVLDPNRKLAVISSTAKKTLEVYNTFENFQNMEGFFVDEVGQKHIDGKLATGFQLTKENENRQIMVWADPETQLPILIEETKKDAHSCIFHAITTDILFDVELDQSLFSLEPPQGYKEQRIDGPLERSDQLAKRTQSVANMDRILKTCLDYVGEHDGEWPSSLDDLVNYGLNNETLVNPRQPERENGYVYLKPEGRLSPPTIVLYEAYDVWDWGINVGFVDGHVEFIKGESDFSKRLLK